MTPYIVTTKRRWADAASNTAGTQLASRRAVATLEETREVADDAVFAAFDRDRKRPGDELPPPYMALSIDARDLPESGGTVGPLPDGTVIEVERTGWTDLLMAAHITGGSDAQILDAFNARQS